MPTDDDKDTKTPKLNDRDQFLAWKRSMRLYAMDKGDIYGICDEDGTKGTYAAITTAQGRRKWDEISRQLIGTIGRHIINPTLQSVWSTEYERIINQGAGPPDQRPFMVALAMAALERECAQITVVSAGIARTQFIIALQSFEEDDKKNGTSDAGFICYADKVKEAERKLAAMGVVMSDDEKKQLFFQYFTGTSAETWRISTENWKENAALSFDGILAKGVLKQREINLNASTAAASQVKAFAAKDDDDQKDKNAHFAKGGKSRGGRGGRGGGRNGGRGGRDGAYKKGSWGKPKFDGYCHNCGKYGHKAETCYVGQGRKGAKGGGGKGKGGKGGKGKGGKGKGGGAAAQTGFFVTGFTARKCQNAQVSQTQQNALIRMLISFVGIMGVTATLCNIANTRLLGVQLWLCFLQLLLCFSTRSSHGCVSILKGESKYGFVPLVELAGQKIRNLFENEKSRFDVKANSTIPPGLAKSHRAILDTGASSHIVNTSAYMQRGMTPNSSFSLIGVSGADNKAACSHVGGLCMCLRAHTYSGEPVLLKVNGKGKENALLCTQSPLTLIAWCEMREGGWLMMPDGTGLFHPDLELCIWYELDDDKLLYMPIVDSPDGADMEGESREERESHEGTIAAHHGRRMRDKLPNLFRWYVTFGGPDVTRLRKTGELANIPLDGDLPNAIREFEAAKMQRSYPKHQDKTPREVLEVVTWDMIGPFQTPSLGGAVYSHDAVDREGNLRFTFPVNSASSEAFIEVLREFKALVGTYTGMFVLRVLRFDKGSNYTSNMTRKWCHDNGIEVQYASVAAPHQIRQGERNHAILNYTMRAIMSLANAPKSTWALARKYAAVLNNSLATRYNTANPFIPWSKLGVTVDVDALFPFGCLAIHHKAKEQCADGYLDQRGEVGAFVGWAWQDGVKGIAICLPNYRIIYSVFFKVDVSYFPWRPDGQRRLLADGTFGDEGETARVFRDIPTPFDFNELIDVFHDDRALSGDSANTVDESADTVDGASSSAPSSEPNTSEPNTSETQTGTSESNGTQNSVTENSITGTAPGAQFQRELTKGARICFYFDQGRHCGVYVGPSHRRGDSGKELHHVRWDDNTKYMVQLNDQRRFTGDDVTDMEPGQWAIVGVAQRARSTDVIQSEEAIDAMIFAREYSGSEGLLVPAMAAKSVDPEMGPFTLQQVMKRDDWPDFEAAAETELDTIEQNETYELVDECVPINEGAIVYDTRFVFTRKRLAAEDAQLAAQERKHKKGKAKARLVLRGDQQEFDEFDDDDDYDLDTLFDEEYEEYATLPEGDPNPPGTSDVHEASADGGYDLSEDPSTETAGAGASSKVSAFATFLLMFLSKSFACMSRSVQNTYRQLFSPVMASTVMYLLLALAVSNEEAIFIADVKGAFLFAMLLPDEVVYCRPPKGYENHPKFRGKVMRLRKALYGLKQAPRRWFDTMVNVLAKHGMKRTAIDPCLFVMVTATLVIKAGTHVDDFIFTTNSVDEFGRWFDGVSKDLRISSSAQVTEAGVDYMSLIITYNMAQGYLKFSQRSYIEKALKMFGLENVKIAETPMATGVKFTKEDMPAETDAERKNTYLRMIGVARWVARNACPEATYAVSYLSCFMQSPSKGMMTALVRVFRYFKWTIAQDVDCVHWHPDAKGHKPPGFNVRPGKNQVYSYVDASYLSEERAECRFGAAFFINGLLLCVICKKLPDPVLSSTEAEYHALVIAACEGKFIRMVLEALNEPQHGPMFFGQDNKSCIAIVENAGQHRGRTKHWEAKMRWIEKAEKEKTLGLVHVNTDLMVADIWTKALAYDAFARHAAYCKGIEFPAIRGKKRKVRFDEEE